MDCSATDKKKKKVNFAEVRRVQLVKYTLTSSLVLLGSFQIF